MYEDIHREEARSTDHDQSAQELTGIAPPCDECGEREAVDGRGLCSDCLDDDTDGEQ
jgi:hypothetical protein